MRVSGEGLPGLAVYNDGVRRGTPVTSLFDSIPLVNGPPGYFFGVSSSLLYVFAVSPTAITYTSFSTVLTPGGGGNMFYTPGRLHVGRDVVDVSTPTAPAKLGTFTPGGAIAPHSANRLVMLSAPPSTAFPAGDWELRLLETETFTQKGSVKVPAGLLATDLAGEGVYDMAYLGGDAVAFIATTPRRMMVMRAPMLANDGVGAGGAGGGGGGGAGGTGGGAGAGGGGGSPRAICAGCTLQKIDVPGFHMVHDPVKSRLYAVATYDAPHDPNTLSAMDATNGAVLATVPIDPYPRQLAVSDDGATLWIGFDMAHSIRKVSVSGATPVLGAAYRLPSVSGMSGATAIDLAALPGAATSIAACISGFTTSRVAILDDGIARTKIDGATIFVSRLAVGPTGTLFGYEASSSGFRFTSYAVDASGATLLSQQGGLLGGFDNDIHYHQGRVYGDGGEVVDVSNPMRPTRIGKFAWDGVVAPRSANRLLMLQEGPIRGTLQLRILETDNFTQVATLSLGSGFYELPNISDLYYLGGDGVAFLSEAVYGGDSVFIFRSPMIGSPP
jgi:hypothetical protein